MDNKIIYRYTLLLLISFVFFACNDDTDPNEDLEYYSGIFIVNEGNFGNGTGTIDYINRNSDVVESSIFQKVNDVPVGNVAQSLFFYEDYGYIMVNNAAKIEVVNSNSFKSISTILDIPQPRNMIEMNGRLFVSAWGDGFVGGVYEISPQTHDVLQSKSFANGPEAMSHDNESLYVTRSGGYGRDSVVMVLDPEDLSIQKEIVVGDNPVSIKEDFAGNLWVLCTGYTDFSDPSNSTEGSLVKIADDNVVASYEVPNGSKDLVMTNSKDFFYFIRGGAATGIVKQGAGAITPLFQTWKNSPAYSLGIDPKSKLVYLGLAKDFASNGEVVSYESDGTLVNSYETGIIPGSFAFKQ